ncbi:MAG TPA: DUF2079 domain-containing protein [Candidatus Baltobacteraceae bacterium]|nr:DUF2079 domain-containing protein [Candidatus Baltobacteraceae bacterium]
MRRSLGIAVGLVIAVMSALAIVRWNVWSYGTDTGTFAQIAHNAFHGFTDGPEHGTHFRFHWSPILALLWPIVAATRSPLGIQIAQVVLIAITAIPLAAIVRTYAGEKWALRVAVLALIYPPLLSASFEEFHELAFYPVTALALFWAADRARWIWFAVFALAAVLIREDACVDLLLIGIALGIIGLVKRQSAQGGLLYGEPIAPNGLAVAGFALAAVSAAVLALYAYVIVPHAGGWAPSHFYRYPFADGPAQTALAIFTHPLALGASVLTLGRLTYLLEAFAPLAFLPLRTRWVWLALPGFAGVLLASDSIVWRMGFHYELLWAPWLLLAAAWALIRIAQRSEPAARRWWTAAVAICVIVLAAFNPMHPAHYLTRAPYQHSSDVTSAFACVPRDARVATHDEWFAHEALTYPHSTNIEEGVQHFDGYIAYTPAWRNAYVETHVLPQLRAALRQGRYSMACRSGGVLVLRPSRTAE